MMTLEHRMKYRSMNVNHLLDDELEHELAIRAVQFSGDESRDTKRRRLRNVMKVLRENNEDENVLDVAEGTREVELQTVDLKLAKIRDALENRKAKKAEYPQLQTRLLHIYFRLIRLKRVGVDVGGLDQLTFTLLNDHFSFLSTDPEALANYSKRLQEDFEESRLEAGNASEADDEEDEGGLVQATRRAKITSTPRGKRKQPSQSKQMFEELLDHVNRMITEKLSDFRAEVVKEVEATSRTNQLEEPLTLA